MEPFEWLVLGVGVAIGGLIGANSKGVMRSAARGYLAVGEKTREWTGNMREDFQDALEEARYDREEADYEADQEDEPAEREHMRQTKRPARSRAASRSGSSGKSSRSSTKDSDEKVSASAPKSDNS